MLEVYQAQTMKPSLDVTLGRGFMADRESLYRHPAIKTAWGKCLSMGIPDTESAFAERLPLMPEILENQKELASVRQAWKEIDGAQEISEDVSLPRWARGLWESIPWASGEQLRFGDGAELV